MAGGVDVSGATTSTYTPVAGDVGKAITVRVTASRSGYTNASSTSAATAAVTAATPAITNVTVPTISGTAKVGQSLTATAGTWNPSDATTTFQWLAGGVDVSGATASTYTPVAGTSGKAISVRVTASKAGYTTASSTSAATANVVAGTIANVSVPTITGTAQVGQLLTATAGTWNPSGVTTAFQWVAGGVDVSGATGSTYTPVAADVGKVITVRVTASKSGYTSANATSAATATVVAGTIANVTVPTISGTAKVGQLLTATAGTWNPSGVATTFQWPAGGLDVSGATASTYTPVPGDLGKGISVRVTASKTGYSHRERDLGRHLERGGRDHRERHGADHLRDREGRPAPDRDGRHLEPE